MTTENTAELPPDHANDWIEDPDGWRRLINGSGRRFRCAIANPDGDEVYASDGHPTEEEARAVAAAYVTARRQAASEDRSEAMRIGEAIALMGEGARVRRAGWNGKGMWLALQVPDEHSKMSLPYLYLHTPQGDLVPWVCSQLDLLAADWELVR